MSSVIVFIALAVMLLVGVPTSYALNQRVARMKVVASKRLPVTKKTSFLFSLSFWSYAALVLVLVVIFPKHFWAVFVPCCIVGYVAVMFVFIRNRKHRLDSTSIDHE